jgi:hypothetical protein
MGEGAEARRAHGAATKRCRGTARDSNVAIGDGAAAASGQDLSAAVPYPAVGMSTPDPGRQPRRHARYRILVQAPYCW